ncbi:MAG: tRNA (guanine(10)-N(2))-dimethyltransferase [Crenarchaeota archaeon]|nr:tRNA (guanine(10)-N(2))-dimethyltransferase [Thermoproteota archaeon]
MDFPLEVITEGKVKLAVPKMSEYLRPDGVYEPAHAPVFYNPSAKFNRDVAVAFGRALKEELGRLDVLEPLAGSGVRSLRYAVESGATKVLAVDANPLAVELIKYNIKLNKLEDRVKVLLSEANAVLHSRELRDGYYDLVDVDPFGSPMPFADGAVRATRRRGLVAVTATDTAPLTGARPQSALRKYGALIRRTPFSKEVAVRVLVGAMVRVAAVREVALRPEAAFFKDYYVRAELRLDRGAGRADEALSNLGYLFYNEESYEVRVVKGYPVPEERPQGLAIGPLWLGPLTGPLARKALELAEGEVREFLRRLVEEDSVGTPYSYKIEKVASLLKINMPSPRLVVERLKELGYKALLTHYDHTSVKTDAPREEVFKAVEELGSRPQRGGPAP